MKVSEMLCSICGEPSTCIGRYEDSEEYDPACDECCGHGCEDGHCIRCTEEDPCSSCSDDEACDAVALLVPMHARDVPRGKA